MCSPRQVVAVAHPLELALHITLPLLIRDEIGQRMQQGVIIPIGFRVIHADEPGNDVVQDERDDDEALDTLRLEYAVHIQIAVPD